MKVDFKTAGACLLAALVLVGGTYKVTKDSTAKDVVDTIFAACYNGYAVMVDQATGRTVACMGLNQDNEDRLKQQKFERELDKRNEA